jgi:hypothetical protein
MKHTTTFEECMTDREIVNSTLFILDQGWYKKIKKCAEKGASIVLPNLELGPGLLIRTLVNAGQRNIATTAELWEEINEVLSGEDNRQSKWNVILFNN